MDLLIENESGTYQLSDFNVQVVDVDTDSPKISSTRTSINFKDGKLFAGAVYEEREITVSGYYYSDNPYEDQEQKDKLNFLLLTKTPFFISPMYAMEGMYGYERPGENSGEQYMATSNFLPYKYGWRVVPSEEIDFEFQGRSKRGLLTKFAVKFVTADVPFGITSPQTIDITDQSVISYSGTAELSQLVWPFVVQLTATEQQTGEFELVIDGQKFTYKSDQEISNGDVFQLKGSSFLLNNLNINDKTNIQYFILKPSVNKRLAFSTTFKGTVQLVNFVELYL